MIESIITLLIYVCLLALVVYLIVWVLGVIGVPLPEKVIQIIWVIVALIVVLMILQTILPRFGVKIALISEAIAQQRARVVVPAVPRPLPAQPESIPLIAVPPLLVLYDFNRRINCLDPPDPLGLGGPGFDGKPLDPAKGNVMIPCWQRRAGGSPTPTR